jgi:hypothetical protein
MLALRGHHPVANEYQAGIVEENSPAWFCPLLGFLVPYSLEVLVFLFDDCSDSIRLPDSVDREITAVLGEGFRLKTDGAAVDMAIEGDDIVGIGEQRIGMKVVDDIYGCDISCGLRDVLVADDALHGGADNAGSMLGSLLPDIVPGLDEKDA